MTAFQTNVDIMNRALQHCGARRIATVSDTSPQAAEVVFAYDKLRVAELRRSVWRFATRRAVLRAFTSTMFYFVPALYNPATAYVQGDIVIDSSGVWWINLVAATGKTPGSPTAGFPLYWTQYFGPTTADIWANAPTTTYYPGDVIYKSGPTFYVNTALGVTTAGTVDPALGAPWHAFPAPQVSGAIILPAPVGSGLTFNNRTRGIYFLPNGFLRLAAPDPKVESTSNLATSGAIQFNDWALEGNILVSSQASPIVPFRFVADVSDVPSMDALFCEALGARTGFEVAPRLTQSIQKQASIAQAYQKFMRDARLINAIEIGSTEPEEEDLELTKGPQGIVEPAPAQNEPAPAV